MKLRRSSHVIYSWPSTLTLCPCQWSDHRGQKAASAHPHQLHQACIQFTLVSISASVSASTKVSAWAPINLVSKNEDGAVWQLLVRQQRLQLTLRLVKPGPEVKISTFQKSLFPSSIPFYNLRKTIIPPVTGVDEEDNGINCWEVILPDSTRLVVTPKIECGESARKVWSGATNINSPQDICHHF